MAQLTIELTRCVRRRLLPALLASILILPSAPWAGALPVAPQTSPATQAGTGRLALAPDEGVQANGPTAAYRDFGTLDPITTKRLETTFHLRNEGSDPIVISYIQPSCGCESVVLAAEGSRDPNTIAAGAQVAVRVSVDVSHLRAGPISKLAMVYLRGKNAPAPSNNPSSLDLGASLAFTLEVRAVLPPLVAFTPRALDFGRLAPGVGRALPLMVTIDKRLLAATPPPKLVCNNPDIKIELQPESASTPPAQPNDRTVTQTYMVTLARNARLGNVGGAVAMVPGDSPAANPVPTPYGIPAIITDGIGGANVIISGQIAGKFAAVPYLAVFGSLLQGTQVTRRIQLTGLTPEILNDLTLSCSPSSLSARIVPLPSTTGVTPTATPNAGVARPAVILEITLSAQAPAGGLSGEVTVTAQDGERLVVPVVGDVIKADPSAKTP
jgi:hypothetical protein